MQKTSLYTQHSAWGGMIFQKNLKKISSIFESKQFSIEFKIKSEHSVLRADTSNLVCVSVVVAIVLLIKSKCENITTYHILNRNK